MKHSKIYTDLTEPITLKEFLGEKYFFTFTDDVIQETKTYIGKEKSEWLAIWKLNILKHRLYLNKVNQLILF